jgi:hypothetical protein
MFLYGTNMVMRSDEGAKGVRAVFNDIKRIPPIKGEPEKPRGLYNCRCAFKRTRLFLTQRMAETGSPGRYATSMAS